MNAPEAQQAFFKDLVAEIPIRKKEALLRDVTRIFVRVRDEDNLDQPTEARLQLLSWAHANDTFFIKRLDDQESLQRGSFRGEILGVKGHDSVAIFPRKVYGMLRRFGFFPRSVLIQWRAQGVMALR